MKQRPELTYAEVHAYVLNYQIDNPHYNPNGAIHLMLAALDNLQKNGLEVDFEEIPATATKEQRKLLIKIGRLVESYIPDEDEDD